MKRKHQLALALLMSAATPLVTPQVSFAAPATNPPGEVSSSSSNSIVIGKKTNAKSTNSVIMSENVTTEKRSTIVIGFEQGIGVIPSGATTPTSYRVPGSLSMFIGVNNFLGTVDKQQGNNTDDPQYATAIGVTNAVVRESTAIGRWNNRVFFTGGKNAATSTVNFAPSYQNFIDNVPKIGVRSTAIGTYNLSQGYGSVAIGYQNETKELGREGVALGAKNSAGNMSASAIGHGNYALSSYASSIGKTNKVEENAQFASAIGAYNTVKVGQYAMAIGGSNTADGKRTSAIGNENTAKGEYASAIGNKNQSTGENATAIGYNNTISGDNALGMGNINKVTGAKAVAFGRENTVTNADNTIVVGANNTGESQNSVLVGAFNVAKANQAVVVGSYNNNMTLTKKATESSDKVAAQTVGAKSTAVGYGNNAAAEGAVAVGYKSKVTGAYATAVGAFSNATAANAWALGSEAAASGANALAVGVETKATQESAIALGTEAQADKADGVALGSHSTTTTDKGVAGYKPSDLYSGLTGKTQTANTAAVSIGNATHTRQLVNLAAGSADTDAVNVAQLKALQYHLKGDNGSSGKNLQSEGVSFLGTANQIVTTAEKGKVTFKLADNVVEDIEDNKLRSEGNLAALGGGAAYNPATNAYTQPTYTVDTPTGTQTFHTVGDAISALNGGFTLTTSKIAQNDLQAKVTGSSNAKIVAGSTVDVTAGRNIEIAQAGGKITIGTTAQPTFSVATFGSDAYDKKWNVVAGRDGLFATKIGVAAFNENGQNVVPKGFTADANVTDFKKVKTTGVPDLAYLADPDLPNNDAADVQSAAVNKKYVDQFPLKYKGDTGEGSHELYKKLSVLGTTDEVTTTAAPGKITIALADKAKKDIKSAKDQADGVTKALGGGASYDPNTGTFTAPSYPVPNRNQAPSTVADAIAALGEGFKVTADNAKGGTANGASEESVKAGDRVKYIAGKNMVIDQAGKDFTFSVTDDPKFNTVTTNKINNLAKLVRDAFAGQTQPGPVDPAKLPPLSGIGNPQAPTDAANKDYVDNAVADMVTDLYVGANDSKVNDDRVNLSKTDDYVDIVGKNGSGITTKVNGKKIEIDKTADQKAREAKTNALTDAAATALGSTYNPADGTVTAPSFTVNDGDTPHSHTTIQDALSALNAGFKVNSVAAGGEVTGSAETAVGTGHTLTFKAGRNIKIDQAGRDFTVSVADAPHFDTVKVGGTPTTPGTTIAGDKITTPALETDKVTVKNGGPTITKDGISGLKDPTADDQAVNKGYLDNLIKEDDGGTKKLKGLTFKGNVDDVVYKRRLGEEVFIKGGATNPQLNDFSADNLATRVTADGVLLMMKKVPNFQGVVIGDPTNPKLSLAEDGVTLKDGTDETKLTPAGLEVKDGPSVKKAGIDAANKNITNVGDPTDDGDAVNLRTLNDRLSDQTLKYAGDSGKHTMNLADTIKLVGEPDEIVTEASADAAKKDYKVTFKLSQTFKDKIDDIKKQVEGNTAALGGNAAYDPATDTYTAPTYDINDGDTVNHHNTVGDALAALNKGFKVKGDVVGSGVNKGDPFAEKAVGPGHLLTLKAGDNLALKQEDREFTFSLNPDLKINSVDIVDDQGRSTGNKLDKNGLEAKKVKVTGVDKQGKQIAAELTPQSLNVEDGTSSASYSAMGTKIKSDNKASYVGVDSITFKDHGQETMKLTPTSLSFVDGPKLGVKDGTGLLNMGSEDTPGRIINVADPKNPLDAVNKRYIDDLLYDKDDNGANKRLKGLNFVGNLLNPEKEPYYRQLGDEVKIYGTTAKALTADDETHLKADNLATRVTKDGVQVLMRDDPHFAKTTVGGTKEAPKVTADETGVTVGDPTKDGAKLTKEGTHVHDAKGNSADYGADKAKLVDADKNSSELTAKDLTFKDKDGNVTKVDATGLTITGGPSVTKKGIDAGGKRITGVATPVAGTDAVNKDYLDDAVKKVTDVAMTGVVIGDDAQGKKDGINLSKNKNRFDIVGAEGSGLVTAVKGNTITIDKTEAQKKREADTNAKADGATTALGGGAGLNDDGTFKAPSFMLYDGNEGAPQTKKFSTVGDALTHLDKGFKVKAGKVAGTNGDATDLGGDGVRTGDTLTLNAGDNITIKRNAGSFDLAVAKDATFDSVSTKKLSISDGGNSIELTPKGIDMRGNKITGLAAGEAPTDAVNVEQLNEGIESAKRYADAGIAAMGNQGRRQAARAGAMSAALAAMHPLDYDEEHPSIVTVGYGRYEGLNALSVGYMRYFSRDALLSVGVALDGDKNHMFNLGASFRVGNSPKYEARRVSTHDYALLKRVETQQNTIQHQSQRLAEQDATISAQGQMIEELLKRVEALEGKGN